MYINPTLCDNFVTITWSYCSNLRKLYRLWQFCDHYMILLFKSTSALHSVTILWPLASFCYLGDMLSAAGGCELSTTTRVKTAWKKFKGLLPVLSSPHLFQNTWPCVQLLCAECNAPCQRDLAIDKAEPPASAAKWQGNDQTDLQCQATRHFHHQVQWSTCAAWHWGSGPHSEGEKTSMVWTCGTLQWCNQDSLWHTGWWKAWAWKAQNDMEAADREGLQRVEALGYQPSW